MGNTCVKKHHCMSKGNGIIMRKQTDRRMNRQPRWIQYTPPTTSLAGGINMHSFYMVKVHVLILHIRLTSIVKALAFTTRAAIWRTVSPLLSRTFGSNPDSNSTSNTSSSVFSAPRHWYFPFFLLLYSTKSHHFYCKHNRERVYFVHICICTGLEAIIRQKSHILENFSISVNIIKFWQRYFQKGYLKSIPKLLEKFVKFESKIEIRPPENIEKITQFSGSRTAIIWHQGIRASKMALEVKHIKLGYTTAFVLGKHVNFLIVC